jgi:hypothetical protein
MPDQFTDSSSGVKANAISSSDADAEVSWFVRMIHERAAPLKGKGRLVVASYGDDPATGEDLTAKVEQFERGY